MSLCPLACLQPKDGGMVTAAAEPLLTEKRAKGEGHTRDRIARNGGFKQNLKGRWL